MDFPMANDSKYENLAPYTFVNKYLIPTYKDDAMPMVCVKPNNPREGSWVAMLLTDTTNLQRIRIFISA